MRNRITGRWAPASEIAAAVGDGRTSATAVVGAALARIAKRNPVLNAFTAVVEERALARAEAIDAARAEGRRAGAARRRAVRGQEPVRRRGPADARRLEDQSRPAAGRARRHADRAARSARRRAGRRAQHGRIRLRLHRRERARRTFAQSARHHTHDRRLVRRLRRRGRRRPRAARARFRHQRLDPRAVVAVRDFRPEADLWPAVARPHVSLRREPRSSRSAGAIGARSRARLRRHAGPRSRRSGLRRTGRRVVATPLLDRGTDGLRIAVAGGYFRNGAFPEAQAALDRVAAALGVAREIELPEARAGARRGLCHHRDRRRGAASRSPAHAARGISIRRCATA